MPCSTYEECVNQEKQNMLYPTDQKSLYQNIEDECFKRDGHLYDEFDLIFDSLFRNSKEYKKIIEVIAQKRKGLTFEEIKKIYSTKAKIANSSLHKILSNLYECDFISKRVPLFNEKKGALYSILDEFVLFYLKWIKSNTQSSDSTDLFMQSIIGSQSYKIWLGFSFEMLCLKHQAQIKKTLGLHKISTNPGVFYAYDKKSKKRSVQIDLLFDRGDKTITMCEIKHYHSEYELNKKDIENIKNKKKELKKYLLSKQITRRNILIAFISLHGMKRNRYFNELQPEVVVLGDLIQ